MNFFQWICVAVVIIGVIYAIRRFLLRNRHRMCPDCRQKELASIDWSEMEQPDVQTWDSESDLSASEDEVEDDNVSAEEK